MKGKSEAFAGFRDVLAGEMRGLGEGWESGMDRVVRGEGPERADGGGGDERREEGEGGRGG